MTNTVGTLQFKHPAQVSPDQCGLGGGGVQGGGGFAQRGGGDKGAEECQGIKITHSSVVKGDSSRLKRTC